MTLSHTHSPSLSLLVPQLYWHVCIHMYRSAWVQSKCFLGDFCRHLYMDMDFNHTRLRVGEDGHEKGN